MGPITQSFPRVASVTYETSGTWGALDNLRVIRTGVAQMQTSNHRQRFTAWRREKCEGQALVIFALFSLVLIGAMAMSVDAGFLMAERRQVQSAADAGALAAAKGALDSKPAGEVTGAGQSYAAF